jgi:hypothetical protein
MWRAAPKNVSKNESERNSFSFFRWLALRWACVCEDINLVLST